MTAIVHMFSDFSTRELLSTILAVAFCVAALLYFKKPGRRALPSEWPLYARRPLTQPEQVLYHRLAQALGDHVVLAQVQLSRVLGVKKGHNRLEWLNRINRMSVDFVVCAKDFSVVAVIELDDASHERRDRKEADAKKEAALTAAGIPLFRLPTCSLPSVEELCSLIAQVGHPAGQADLASA